MSESGSVPWSALGFALLLSELPIGLLAYLKTITVENFSK